MWGRLSAVAFLLCATAVQANPERHPEPEAAPREQPEHPEQAAYTEMVRADAARDAELPAEAITRYTRALALFRKMAEESPRHMPGAVAFRIRYCEQEIEALRSADAAHSAVAAVEAVREIRELRQRIAKLEAALREAERASKPAATVPPQ